MLVKARIEVESVKILQYLIMTTLNPVNTKRLPALDIFRGLTILAMLVVNEIHTLPGTPDFLRHVAADQDGMSFADIIFPAFLFITGMAIPVSIKSGISLEQILSIVKRSAALIILGLFMVNAEAGFQAEAMLISPKLWAILSLLACYLIWGAWPACPATYRLLLRLTGGISLVLLALLYQDGSAQLSAMQTQWWGILGLIGWAYLLCACLYMCCRQHPLLSLLAQLALLMLVTISPQGSYLHHHPHLSHSIIMLAGVLTFELLHGRWSNRFFKCASHSHSYLFIAILAVLYLAAAEFAHTYSAYSKIQATPPWVLTSIAVCICSYAFLHALSLRSDWYQRIPWFMLAAQNALLCYTLPYLIYPGLQRSGLSYPWLGADFISGTLMIALYACVLVLGAGLLQARGLRWQI